MVSVVSIGVGAPKMGMGWYHLTQFLEEPRVQVRAVVEPWFLGLGKGGPNSQAFQTFCEEVKRMNPNVDFRASVEELPDLGGKPDNPVIALIAARTSDALTLFTAICKKGVTYVYVEKPGGESAAQLQEMQEIAKKSGVTVLVGYNKNVSEYVQEALAVLQKQPDLPVTLEHNNPFAPGDELAQFAGGPGSEGMVHNMLCHELAMAVCYFGLHCDSIASLTLNAEKSKLFTLPDGRTDWERLAFSVNFAGEGSGTNTTLAFDANRCGGNFSQINLGAEGESRQSFRLPSQAHEQWIEKMRAQDPDIRGYFLLQSADYKCLKGRLIDHIQAGKPGIPHGAVDLAGALEVLRLADFLAPLVKTLWNDGAPWQWARK